MYHWQRLEIRGTSLQQKKKSNLSFMHSINWQTLSSLFSLYLPMLYRRAEILATTMNISFQLEIKSDMHAWFISPLQVTRIKLFDQPRNISLRCTLYLTNKFSTANTKGIAWTQVRRIFVLLIGSTNLAFLLCELANGITAFHCQIVKILLQTFYFLKTIIVVIFIQKACTDFLIMNSHP